VSGSIASAYVERDGVRLRLFLVGRAVQELRPSTDDAAVGLRQRAAAGLGLAALVGTSTAGYVVRPGDTLSGIARDLGTTVPALASLNAIADPHIIHPGVELAIPAAATSAAPAAPSTTGATYTVKSGDALSRIARTYGVSTSALAKANGIADVHRIRVGQVLQVPGSASTPAASAPAAPAAPSASSYRVVAGDALSRIARSLGVSTSALAKANDISDVHRIYVGQVLKVPGGTSSAAPAAAPTAAPTGSLSKAQVGALIDEIAGDYGWNPAWIKALAWQESGWQQSVVSSVGARGIMQVMPGTGSFISRSLVGRTLDLGDPRDNVIAGVAFLDYLYDLTGGDIDMTLAGYYQGLGSVRRNGMYTDTERYIRNITALKARFS